MGRPAEERRAELVKLYRELNDQHGCPLAGARTHVVFGMGNADADLMFVGEAPGATEDQGRHRARRGTGRASRSWAGPAGCSTSCWGRSGCPGARSLWRIS